MVVWTQKGPKGWLHFMGKIPLTCGIFFEGLPHSIQCCQFSPIIVKYVE